MGERAPSPSPSPNKPTQATLQAPLRMLRLGEHTCLLPAAPPKGSAEASPRRSKGEPAPNPNPNPNPNPKPNPKP